MKLIFLLLASAALLVKIGTPADADTPCYKMTVLPLASYGYNDINDEALQGD